jgi:hypothetical protein
MPSIQNYSDPSLINKHIRGLQHRWPADMDPVAQQTAFTREMMERNNSPEPRVAFRLRGTGSNTEAIGASVTLSGGKVPLQKQEIVSGGRYLSGFDTLVSFAAATGDAGMCLNVRWRSGKMLEIQNIRPKRIYLVDEKK